MNHLLADGNEQFLKEELSNYFTNTVVLEKGWNVGAGSRVIDKTKDKNVTVKQALAQIEKAEDEGDNIMANTLTEYYVSIGLLKEN